MVHANYEIAPSRESPSGQPQYGDNSYRSCICAMLTFIAICVIILVASLLIGRRTTPQPTLHGESSPSSAEAHGDRYGGKEITTKEREVTAPVDRTSTTESAYATFAKFTGEKFGDLKSRGTTKSVIKTTTPMVTSTTHVLVEGSGDIPDDKYGLSSSELPLKSVSDDVDHLSSSEMPVETGIESSSSGDREEMGLAPINVGTSLEPRKGSGDPIEMTTNSADFGSSESGSALSDLSTITPITMSTTLNPMPTKSINTSTSIPVESSVDVGTSLEPREGSGELTEMTTNSADFGSTESKSALSDLSTVPPITMSTTLNHTSTKSISTSTWTPVELISINSSTTPVSISTVLTSVTTMMPTMADTKILPDIHSKHPSTTPTTTSEFIDTTIPPSTPPATTPEPPKTTPSLDSIPISSVSPELTPILSSTSTTTTTNSPLTLMTVVEEEGNSSTTVISTPMDPSEFEGSPADVSSSTESTSTAIPIDRSKHVCNSPYCYSKSAEMLGRMDHLHAACHDMYQFACGRNQVSREQILRRNARGRIRDQLGTGHRSSAHRKFEEFYETCVMHDPLTVNITNFSLIVQRAVGQFLNMSEIMEDWPTHFSKLLARMLHHNSAPLFDVDMDISATEEKFVFAVLPPKRSILGALTDELEAAKCQMWTQYTINKADTNLAEVYASYSDCLENGTQYVEQIREILKRVKFLGNISDLSDQIQEEYLPKIHRFPTNYEQKTSRRERGYVKYSIAELQSKFRFLNWEYFFNLLVGKHVSVTSPVYVYAEDVLDELFESFATVDEGLTYNMLLSIFTHDVYRHLSSSPAASGRNEFCLNVATTLLPDIASTIYMKSFAPEALDRLTEHAKVVFDDLKRTFEAALMSARYLKEADITSAVRKLTSVHLSMYDVTTAPDIDKTTTSLSIIPGDFLPSLLNVLRRFSSRKFGLWNQAPGKNIWSYNLSPFDVESVSNYHLNTIVLPFGMFVDDRFDEEPRYVTMSTLGVRIARHIAEHFDPIGQKTNMLTMLPRAQALYQFNIHQCFLEQYAFHDLLWEISGREYSFKLSSADSVNERISDAAGLRLAYDTFKSGAVTSPDATLPWLSTGFNQDKLFYVSAVQEFCGSQEHDVFAVMKEVFAGPPLPGRLRVLSFLSNDETFPRTFDCINGTMWNPSLKCHQFPHIPDDEYDDDDGPMTHY